ncbi:binding-protein-dependent transport system inner membrane protein [Candidatus Omnitrophus magneticus]|uniref:Binding-protein-dependent transport system inner membrane protein n=1 Tax=Candidatus Omnitrophus magneticus TaxID=1609969 RepID=A0A0F0CQC1_9BACT|nr:binding-protein-dependent transport system inner membrane protein [Candidatus Omnitrophus magneticus]
MLKYFIKKFIFIIPLLLGISFLLFMLMHFSPGDPSNLKYGLNPSVSMSARENFNKMYGLDKPLLQQYAVWIKKMFFLDFGNSLIDGKPVMKKIMERLPVTLLLSGVSLVVTIFLAIPIGIITAVKRGTFFDNVTSIFLFAVYSIPSFWIALVLIFVFGFKLKMFPVSGMTPWFSSYLSPFFRVVNLFHHMVLPVTAIALSSIPSLARYTRSSMIGVLHENYIVSGRAKGLSEYRVVMSHAFRNALLPIITLLTFILPSLISGSFIFESIFSWPGMGRLGYEAIMNYDYPLVMGIGVISIFLTLISILLVDLLYAWCDPRIRYGAATK